MRRCPQPDLFHELGLADDDLDGWGRADRRFHELLREAVRVHHAHRRRADAEMLSAIYKYVEGTASPTPTIVPSPPSARP